MRVGIWCDYGFTLEPSEGIGVFVDCLSRGLVRANRNVEILLMPHPGQESVLSPTVAQGFGRIHIAQRPKLHRWRRQALRTCRKLRRSTVPDSTGPVSSGPGSTGPDSTGPGSDSRWAGRALADRVLEMLVSQLERTQQQRTQLLINTCDVWLVPYVGLEQRFSRPTVVVVHDLVSYHFSDVMKPGHLRQLKWQVDRQVSAAARVACMSRFIRDQELFGELGLPPDRVQVIPPAVPEDCGQISTTEVALPDALRFNEPFLFYPAAFRTYKNHQLLVALIPKLKQSGLWPMKIVFTGIRRCPRWLRSVITACDAQDDVVVLGKVTRDQLASIYRRALATVVPSLYEQGSFPILEALHWGCPAAAADIPPLREQFAGMADDMLYFDPQDTESLFQQVAYLAAHRQTVIDKQQRAFAKLRERTWKDAAVQWLAVFDQAVRERDAVNRRLSA